MNVIMKPQPIPQTRFIRFTHEGPAEPTGGSSTPQSTIHFTPGTEARPTKIHQDTEAMLKCDVSKKHLKITNITYRLIM